MLALFESQLQLRSEIISRKNKTPEFSMIPLNDMLALTKLELSEYQHSLWTQAANLKIHCSSQRYGPIIEKEIIKAFQLTRLSPLDDSGDALENTMSYEVKVSLSDTGKFNFVQIRPWQNLNFYTFFLFDCGEDIRQPVLMLCHNVPAQYVTDFARAHGNRAHGGKGDELRFTINSKNDKYEFLNFVSKFDLFNDDNVYLKKWNLNKHYIAATA